MKWLSFLMICVGIVYAFMIRVDINKENSGFIVDSRIEQIAKFHIRTKSDFLFCNETNVSLDKKTAPSYWYHGEREVLIPLHKGTNKCHIVAESHKVQIRQKISYLNYIILFILVGFPFIYLLFIPSFWLIDKIKQSQKIKPKLTTTLKTPYQEHSNNQFITKSILFILLAGFIIRIAYFQKFGIMAFQHDWHGHIDFIKFISQNWFFPIPTQEWEYPQQPLYYMISGGLYSLFIDMGLNSQEAIYNIGYFSLFCSFFFLIYSYRFIALLTPNKWVQAVAMAFLSFTPSIVYLSARINNDVLVLMLAATSLYYIVKSYQSQFEHGFIIALISTSLLFLTKISAASIELLFFMLLLIVYSSQKNFAKHLLRQKLLIFSLVGLFLVGFTLLKVYLPLENSFHLVNAAIYPGQELKLPYIEYFTSFNIKDLIIAGQSYVFGVDSIRQSFISYEYGTLFFGEFDYIDYVISTPYIQYIMQLIYSLGLIYIIGFMSFCIYLYRESFLKQMLFAVLLINFILIVKFVITYPSICHTDFRFFVSSFPIIAFIVAQGLEKLFYYKFIKLFISTFLILLFISELLFFYFLIYG